MALNIFKEAENPVLLIFWKILQVWLFCQSSIVQFVCFTSLNFLGYVWGNMSPAVLRKDIVTRSYREKASLLLSVSLQQQELPQSFTGQTAEEPFDFSYSIGERR